MNSIHTGNIDVVRLILRYEAAENIIDYELRVLFFVIIACDFV